MYRSVENLRALTRLLLPRNYATTQLRYYATTLLRYYDPSYLRPRTLLIFRACAKDSFSHEVNFRRSPCGPESAEGCTVQRWQSSQYFSYECIKLWELLDQSIRSERCLKGRTGPWSAHKHANRGRAGNQQRAGVGSDALFGPTRQRPCGEERVHAAAMGWRCFGEQVQAPESEASFSLRWRRGEKSRKAPRHDLRKCHPFSLLLPPRRRRRR